MGVSGGEPHRNRLGMSHKLEEAFGCSFCTTSKLKSPGTILLSYSRKPRTSRCLHFEAPSAFCVPQVVVCRNVVF